MIRKQKVRNVPKLDDDIPFSELDDSPELRPSDVLSLKPKPVEVKE